MNKKGIKITLGHVANIKTKLKKTKPVAKKSAVAKRVTAVPASPATEPVAAEKKAGNTVTLQHVRAVALTVKTLGGSARLNELLGLIKEVGGLRKMKDLLEAMSLPETDAIPF